MSFMPMLQLVQRSGLHVHVHVLNYKTLCGSCTYMCTTVHVVHVHLALQTRLSLRDSGLRDCIRTSICTIYICMFHTFCGSVQSVLHN